MEIPGAAVAATIGETGRTKIDHDRERVNARAAAVAVAVEMVANVAGAGVDD